MKNSGCTAKMILMAAVILLGAFALVSCHGGSSDSKPDHGGAPGQALVREDEEGLVAVRIVEGAASISFDLARWEQIHQISEQVKTFHPDSELVEGEFPIENESGRIKDAVVGKVPGISLFAYYDFIVPTVFLLMEDGSVEWLSALPRLSDDVEQLYRSCRLPWIRGIESLSYEPESEGRGDMTVFAVDAAGLHYDLRIPSDLAGLPGHSWECTLLYPDEYAGEYVAFLTLEEEGGASLTKGLRESEIDEIYRGSYQISLDDEATLGCRPGIILFDLELSYSVWEDEGALDNDGGIRGSYFIETGEGGASFTLWLSDGDALHEGMDEYVFFLEYAPGAIDVWGLSIDELTEHLLAHAPGVRTALEERGMAVLVTGESTEIEGAGLCRDVWLGTDSADSFVREILYTIDGYGRIYGYDAVTDSWTLVSN